MSQQINLFNPIFLKQKKHFSARTMLHGLGIVLVGGLLIAVYARTQLGAMESQAVASAAQLSTTKAQLATVSAEYGPRQKSKSLEGELLRLESEVRSQRETLEIVQRKGFGNTSGYADHMRAFARQILSGIWLTGFSIQGSDDIEIRGRALHPELVPAYINRLRNEAAMQGKSFSKLIMVTPEADTAAKAPADMPLEKPRQDRAPRFVEFILRSSDEPQSSEAQDLHALANHLDRAGASGQ